MLIFSNPYSTLTITGTLFAVMVHFTFSILLLWHLVSLQDVQLQNWKQMALEEKLLLVLLFQVTLNGSLNSQPTCWYHTDFITIKQWLKNKEPKTFIGSASNTLEFTVAEIPNSMLFFEFLLQALTLMAWWDFSSVPYVFFLWMRQGFSHHFLFKRYLFMTVGMIV